MRYHYEKPYLYKPMYGRVYRCDHAVYDICTLFEIGKKGLAVIQQRYDPETKCVWWDCIDEWIVNELYLHPKFKEVFDIRSGECKDGLYPTMTVRQLMWALRMKPMKKEKWETYFDRKNI